MFLVDGPVLVAEALASGLALEALFVEPEADGAVVAAARAEGVAVTEVAAGSLRKVLDLVNPQSMVAVALQLRHEMATVLADAATRRRPVLALVGIQDPGNAGTLIRVAEAAGCAGVVLTRGSVDLWNPKTVRATAGAVFRVAVATGVDAGALLDAAGAAGVATLATVSAGGVAPESCDLGGACVLLVGAEARGLPAAVEAAATGRVGIPMAGSVESLNAAVAGSVLAFEAARQRRGAAGAGCAGNPSGGA